MFITFVLTAFPEDAYFSRIIMTMAALAVGSSMLAFPIALHNWVVTKDHRFWGIILYYGEMALIAVNTVVSFVTLLGLDIPWVKQYEPFSVGSIIYTVFAWGTLFLLDPQHKEFADEQESDAKLNKKISNLTNTFLDTADGQRLVQELAAAEVANRWTVENHMKRKGLARPSTAIPAPEVFHKKELSAPQPLYQPYPQPQPESHATLRNHTPAHQTQDVQVKISTEFDFNVPHTVWFVERDLPYQKAYNKKVQQIDPDFDLRIDARGVLLSRHGNYPFGQMTAEEIAEIKSGQLPACFLNEKPYEAPAPRSKYDNATGNETAVIDVINANDCTCPPAFFEDNPTSEVKAQMNRKPPHCLQNGKRYYEARAEVMCKVCPFFK
jgi:hypothetical protein